MTPSDEVLAEEARRGSQSAYATLVRRHQSLVRGFLRRLCGGDAALADDLAQEAFLTAWRKIASFQGAGAFRGWLCRIAYTEFLQHRRAAKARVAREERAKAEAEDAVYERDAAEARLDLDRVLAQLSPEQAAGLALCYGEGMSHQEAAEALGLPLGTLKSHVLRGRARALELMTPKEASHG